MIDKKPKPFLKWAGGKTQLIDEIEKLLPNFVYTEKFTYIEPFVGSGAILFWVINNFSNNLHKVVINDINSDLINTYKIIISNPNELISSLKTLESEFHSLSDNIEKKKEYYYSKRDLYNTRKEDNIIQASLFIFLNRTCFNGLYRVNKNNGFNVPMGSYKKPMICNSDNILVVSKALENVEILCGDYKETLKEASNNTLFYIDPPYKPLNTTSSFNSYSKDVFDDEQQIRLRDFCVNLDDLGHTWILSNSDVKDGGSEESFFDILYSKFNINRVKARRNINSKSEKRGELNELLINNFGY